MADEQLGVSIDGDQGVGNEILSIIYDPLILLLTKPGPPSSSPHASSSSLDVEIVSPPESSHHALSLSLPFTPSPSAGLTSLRHALLQTRSHYTSTPVELSYARESAKTPHALSVVSTLSGETLLDLDPLDPSCLFAQSWVSYHVPPPLTKQGKPYKRPRSALAQKAPQREAVKVPHVGGGGLLDALAVLSRDKGRLIGVKGKLKAEVTGEDDDEGEGITFCFELDVYLYPSRFFPAPFSRAKQLLLERLFPAAPEPAGTPKEATIDYFYKCLERAPRTVEGVPVSSGQVLPPPPSEETDEEFAARVRREAKGKARAVPISPSPPPSQEQAREGEEEDTLLRPAGLDVELLPFQSRTVRWMLGREGKRVTVVEDLEDRGSTASGSASGNGSKKAIKSNAARFALPFSPSFCLLTLALNPVSTRSCHRNTNIALSDLPPAQLLAMRRGPLWEEVELPLLSRSISAVSEKESDGRRVWLNRVSGTISEGDPLDWVGLKKEEHGAKKEGEEKGEGMDVDQDHGNKAGKQQSIPGECPMTYSPPLASAVVGEIEGHGLLAEQVGLGKTVMTTALILLHRSPERRKLPSYFNPQTDAQVQPTGLTLIIAPTAIIGQWGTELTKLAPGLRVLRYDGIKSIKDTQTVAHIAKSYDVVLTTYDVLRREVAIARKPHARSLRNKREIRYRRSMLVEMDFLRVIMDEAQMVGDSIGPTSETASLIPRRFSWAVTSTPLRDKLDDLKPLLTFLRVEPIASRRVGLQRLLEEVGSFKRLWNEIGARTLKSHVQHELFLPRQTRYLVPIDFTAVEKYYYDSRYAQALEALGLGSDGTPKASGMDRETGEALAWQPDKGEMNKWLDILRSLCTHPQVGAAGRQALGHVLKTVDEVYAAMREKAVSEIQSDQRAILAVRVRRGQYQMWEKDVDGRFEAALELFRSALDEVGPIIAEVTTEIHAAWKGRKKDRSRTASVDATTDDVAGALQVGFQNDQGQDDEFLTEKERAFARSLSGLRNRLRDLLFVQHSAWFFMGHANFNLKREKEETEAYAQAERLRQIILQPYENHVEKAQATLREQLDARNENKPLEATDLELSFNKRGHGLVAIDVFEDIEITSDILNGYAELVAQYREMIIEMMLKPVSIAGDDATGEEYEERAVLQEQLIVYLEAYTVLVGEWNYGITGTRSFLADQYKAEAAAVLYREENLLPEAPPPPNGIEVEAALSGTFDEVIDAVGGVARPGASGRTGRKRRAVEAELDSEDGDKQDDEEEDEMDELYEGQAKREKAKGEGQAEKTDTQNKALQEKTRTQKKRGANIRNNSYKDFVAPTVENGHAPADVLRYELLVERLEAKGEGREKTEVIPLRHLIKALKDAAEQSSKQQEIALLDSERARISKRLGPLEKVADQLTLELGDFNKSMNARIEYFRQLQEVSDSVADPDMGAKKWRGLLIEIETLRIDENDLKQALAQREQRLRYLDNLSAPEERELDQTCPICAEYFTDGILTQECAHLLCRDCFRLWYARSKNCAMCKTPLAPGSWTAVKYRRKDDTLQPTDEDKELPERDETKFVDSKGVLRGFETKTPPLAELDQAEIDRIREIETTVPLSSKSDFIVKHVKLLRRRDPEAKIVIFSAWQDALQLLMEAFSRNGIQYVRLEGASGKGKKEGVVKRFIDDPDIAAFFLHTKSQSAGLTLTNAQYVMLVEPLLQPSLELQAVARVHRIGQTKETTVFQYTVNDTPDKRVAELRARQNTSLFLADQQLDALKESRLGQQKGLASKEARKETRHVEEAIDDEDDIARCLLAPEAFVTLQRALLPFRLRGAQPSVAAADRNIHEEGAARGHRMGMAGMAAAGRAAGAAEASASGSGTGGGLDTL
ncbi:hypothetical protein JCM21900_002450 [Sporobolomyces salmonicolor]